LDTILYAMQLLQKFRSVRWMEFSGLLVGAALASMLILLTTTAFLTMRSQGIGLYKAEEYQLYCVFDQGLGLRKGTKVLVKGVEVGRVGALELTSDGRVRLAFDIKTEFSPWIVERSEVYATRDQNLIAERIINIVPPPVAKGQQVLPAGSTLVAGDAQDIETVIQKAVALLVTADTLAQKANLILNSALSPHTTLGALIQSRELYDQLLLQVDKIDQITTGTDRLVTTLDQTLPPLLYRTDSIISNADKLVGQIGVVGGKLDTIAGQAMGLISSVDTTLFAINTILGDLRELTQGASHLLIDGEEKVEKADQLMSGLGSFWFIRNRIPKNDTIPLIGHEAW